MATPEKRKAKNVSFFLLLLPLRHTLFPRDFSGTIADTNIINTPLEPLRPTDVPLGGFVDTGPQNTNFGGMNRRFQAKRAKY